MKVLSHLQAATPRLQRPGSDGGGGGPFADDIAVVDVFWSRPCQHCEQKDDGLGAVCLQ